MPFVFIRSIVICLSADGHHITPYTLLSESAGLFTSMTLFVDKIASGKGILHHVDAGHLAVMSIYSGNLPFSVVDQTAGAAVRAPERSPHGLHKV